MICFFFLISFKFHSGLWALNIVVNKFVLLLQIHQYEKEIRELRTEHNNSTYEVTSIMSELNVSYRICFGAKRGLICKKFEGREKFVTCAKRFWLIILLAPCDSLEQFSSVLWSCQSKSSVSKLINLKYERKVLGSGRILDLSLSHRVRPFVRVQKKKKIKKLEPCLTVYHFLN